ncbi:glycosyltransferase [Flavobacterium sp. W21_SRS_FM6]|uniref:glycosyltransferase n=1 Tax=Flavobacterium sp. W21_SRS_FM6 TaxID=3240268 RepID=UPI003F913853
MFFNITTPEKYHSIIRQLQQQCANFTPVFIDGMDAFYEQSKREIRQRLNKPFVITSRLDNDDSLHQDYIKEVQSHFKQQRFMAIDFVDGYTLQIEPHVRFAKRAHTHNPFLSLIESSIDFKTVWFINRHGQWSKIKHVTTVRHKPMWMSVIHRENKVNEFLGFGRVDWHEIDNFNLAHSAQCKLTSQKKGFETWKWRSIKNELKTHWKVNTRLLKRMLTGSYYSGSKI